MSSSNRITNVAIVGASGRQGSAITAELLKTGQHNVTAITRVGSESPIPQGVKTTKVNYDEHAGLVKALNGHQALIITLGTRTPPEVQSNLIRAAGDAGVAWILPNHWSPDTEDEQLCKDVPFFETSKTTLHEIKQYGKSSYIAVACGFWYEWSLAIYDSYGFDIQNRKVTFFDDGKTRVNTSTWPQVGRAVAKLLSLPIKAEGRDGERCVERFRNGYLRVSSFAVSQEDMLASLLRVTGTKEADWSVESVSAKKCWEEAMDAMQKGDHQAFVKVMYTPVFYKNGPGLYETKGLANELLGLPEEELDEFTAVAVERSKGNPYA